MLVILPPSETKAEGGTADRLDLKALRFPELTTRRRPLIAAVRTLARDPEAAMKALKIGPKLRGEVERNRTVGTSPTMPALERYTGVLFDPLLAGQLSDQQRAFAAEHIVIHSALFGLVGAQDLIPAYRLSHDSRVPGHPLKKHWRAVIEGVLSKQPGLILDLRSEAYVELGPAPARDGSYFVRVVAEDASGQKRALNHFNKKGKGEFVRALLQQGVDFGDVDALLEWAARAGIRLQIAGAGELELVVDQNTATARGASTAA